MCTQRLRLVLRVKLTTNEPWVDLMRQFYHFHKLTVRRNPTKHQPFPFQGLAILRIKLVTMTMAFADFLRVAVDLPNERVRRKSAGPRPKAHRATQLLNSH